MASIGRTTGLCCCRRVPSPALHACQSTTTRLACSPQRFPLPTMSSSASSIALLKSFSSWVVNSSLSKRTSDGLASRFRVLSRPKFIEWAVFGRTYYGEGGSSHGSNGSSSRPVAQGSYDQYRQQQQQQQEPGGEVPRPPVIQWEKDLANAVQLIGRVGRDVDLKYFDTGKLVARTSLAVKKGVQKTEEPSWFEIELWDALAEIAAHHIKKGEQIFVSGRILVEKWSQSTVAKVVVRDLYIVESYSNQSQLYGQSNGAEQEEYTEMGSNIQSQQGANLGSSQGNWNQQQLATPSQGTTGAKGPPKRNDEAALATEKKWQEYFTDPTQWWDNRNNKKNPKAPDFKHKSTQEALWINSWNNPPWVLQQMAVLEEKQAQHTADFGDSRQRSQDKKLSSFKESDFTY